MNYYKLSGLKQRNFYLSVLETRNSKLRCQQNHVCSKASLGESFFASSSFSWLLLCLGLWQHNSNLCLHFYCLSLCLYMSFSVSYKGMLIGFRACRDLMLIFIVIFSAETLHSNKVTFWNSWWLWIQRGGRNTTQLTIISF